MRDIYTRGLVTSDFVLVMGDLVSNIRIDEVVRVHKERRKTNKNAIMTMVMKESGAKHRTRCVCYLLRKEFEIILTFFFTLCIDLKENRLYLFWTPKRQSVCTMNIFRDTLGQKASISLAKSCLAIQKSKSGTISWIVQSMCARSRYADFFLYPPIFITPHVQFLSFLPFHKLR